MILKVSLSKQQLPLPDLEQSAFGGDIDALLAQTEARRRAIGAGLESAARAKLGQYFTPMSAASLIAEMVHLPDHGTLRVLDFGAGSNTDVLISSWKSRLFTAILRSMAGPTPALTTSIVDALTVGLPWRRKLITGRELSRCCVRVRLTSFLFVCTILKVHQA